VLRAATKRKILGIDRRFREARMFAKAMRSPRHPIQAHIVPIRRCNLSCTYCHEFDDHSGLLGSSCGRPPGGCSAKRRFGF
jgi:sulfatase maturation enzyme AslB (radical SAM superfamily)